MFNWKQTLLALPLFAAIVYWGDGDISSLSLRRLAVECIHNVYASPNGITKIPPVPPSLNGELPAYISLCQEWIRHDAYYNDSTPYENFAIVEAPSVCADWSAPHHVLMDIHAALIVTAQIKKIKYRHNCDRTRLSDESTLGFDHTTIQQVLNTPGIGTNNNVFSSDQIKQQCRRCLLAYDPQVENVRVKSKANHHCLAWPKDNTRQLNANAIPVVPNKAIGVTAFSSIVTPFRNRMYHSALEWANVTDKPPDEEKTGMVIYLDPTSIGLDYSVFANEIQRPVSSIAILAGPLCATAFLPTGQVCHEYGEGLRDYLLSKFNTLTTNGYKGGPGITFQISASTAATYSRMILSDKLLCPPRTPTCFLPALSKFTNIQTAKILEDPVWMRAVDFFSMSGTHGVVTVKVMDASQIPPTYTSDPNARRERELGDVAEQFSHVNAMLDDEGYPDGMTLPVMASDSDIAALTDQQILDDIAVALNRFKDNPHVHSKRLEIIPTMAMIQEALAKKEPLNVYNVQKMVFPNGLNGNGPRTGAEVFRHGELATDVDSARKQPPPGIEYWTTNSVQRHDSLLRIQSDWETAFYGHISDNRDGDDPSTVYEIACPETTADGGTITYVEGKVTSTSNTAVIIASKDGVIIKDRATGETTATGIENTPTGTAFEKGGGYAVKEVGDTTASVASSRRLVKVDLDKSTLPFTEELERVCREYAKRKLRATSMMKDN